MSATWVRSLAFLVSFLTPAIAQQGDAVITLERTICFGNCPAYVLQLKSPGTISFQMGPPSNRRLEPSELMTAEQFQKLLAGFEAIHFSGLRDRYEPTHTDGPTTILSLTIDGKTQRIEHPEEGLAELRELERTIERTANVHRWLHGDPRRFSLRTPVSGPLMGGGEDLTNETFVRNDAYTRIKPRFTRLMQVAGLGDAAEIRKALQQGEDGNATDETGWTALMVAAVAGHPQSVSALIGAGARVDQKDLHGNTALIGAAAVRFSSLSKSAEVLEVLLSHGASVDATNDLGESALMWAARAGNPDAIRVLLKAGAKMSLTDKAGHDARFYLRDARESLTFDPSLVERYDQAALLFE